VTAKTTASGENATLKFTGSLNQRISVQMTSVTIGTSGCCSTKVSIVKPDGTNLVAPKYIGRTGGFIDTQTLPVAGTYKIFVDPQGTATGSMTVRVYNVPPDASQAITADGTPATAANTVYGQNIVFPFSGSLGQKVSIALGANSIGASATASMTVTILKPDGTALFTPVSMGTAGGFVDTKTLPAGGGYSVLVNPLKLNTGSITIQLFTVVDATAGLTLGSSTGLSTTTPGQNFAPTFSGTAGQRVSALVSDVSVGTPSCCNLDVSILKPDGTALTTAASMGVSGGFVEPVTLPTTGTYTLLVDPQKADVGSLTVTVYDVPADVVQPISANGTPLTLTTTGPGQNAYGTFTGTLNQRVSLDVTNVNLAGPTFPSAKVTILKPDGTALFTALTVNAFGAFVDLKTLPVAGTYKVFLDPQSTTTGSADFALYTVPADVSTTIAANGVSVPVSTTVPGQNAKLTFSGTLNQRVSLNLTGVTMGTNCCNTVHVSIYKPDGTLLFSPYTAVGTNGGFMEPKKLPVAGTYKIVVDPQGDATGSATLTLYNVPADVAGSITAGGAAVPVSLTAPGQNATLSFSGTANQRVSLNITGVTFGTANCCQVKILTPTGTSVSSLADWFGPSGAFIEPKKLPVTGTYKVLVDPQGAAIGNASVQLYNVPADTTGSITVGGAAVPVSLTAPGQNGTLTFSGTSGQTVTVTLSSVTIGTDCCASVNVYVKTSGNATVANSVFGTTGGNFQAVLPSTGTFTILVDPQGSATGGASVGLS